MMRSTHLQALAQKFAIFVINFLVLIKAEPPAPNEQSHNPIIMKEAAARQTAISSGQNST